MNLILCGFVLYFCVVLVLAYFIYTREKRRTYKQAIMGGRSVNYFMTALSAHASDMSDWLFMAFPAAIYMGGLYNAWIGIGLTIGMFLSWTYIAQPLRVATEKYGSITLLSFFSKRFEDQKGTIKIISALFLLFFFSIYIAAGLKGFGYLCELLFEIPYHWGTLIAVMCSLLYIFVGGYKALAWLDTFQGSLLLFTILVVPIYAFYYKSISLDFFISAIKDNSVSLTLIPKNVTGVVNVICLGISWALGYFGAPHILTKFMGIKSGEDIKKSRTIGMIWQCIVLTAAGFVGLLGLVYFGGALQNQELVFVKLVRVLFSDFLSGIIFSAIAGSVIAVVAAQVLVLLTTVLEDIYRGILKPSASEKELIWVYRGLIITVGVLSWLVSLHKGSTIQSLVGYAWMGMGAVFAPIVILALYSKSDYSSRGIVAGMVSSFVVSMIWKTFFYGYLSCLYGLDIPGVIPGFIVGFFIARMG